MIYAVGLAMVLTGLLGNWSRLDRLEWTFFGLFLMLLDQVRRVKRAS